MTPSFPRLTPATAPTAGWRRPIGFVLALVLGLPAVASAAVYRCGTRYSDSPCAGPGQAPETVRAPNGMSAPTAYERATARRYDRETALEDKAARARQERADAAFRQDHAERAATEARVRQGLFERRVVPGMTRNQVDMLFGHPAETAMEGDREVWRWREGRASRSVTFQGDVAVRATGNTSADWAPRGRRRNR